MASIFQLPRVENTGLSRLGEVLLGSAGQYASNKRADDIEARRRAERLTDVESDRTYQRTEGDRLYGRTRTDRLTDVESDRTYQRANAIVQAKLAIAQSLAQQGYLRPDLIDDEVAVKVSYGRAARDGIVRKNPLVGEAMKTGDVTDAMLDDPNALAIGLAAFSERTAGRIKEGETQRTRAGERANQLATEEGKVANEVGQLSARLGERMTEPSPAQVEALAYRMAKAAIPKTTHFWQTQQTEPKREEVAAMMAPAAEELRGQAMTAWNQDKEDAKIQASIAARRLNDVRAEQNTIVNKFGAIGVPMAPAAPAAAEAPLGSAGAPWGPSAPGTGRPTGAVNPAAAIEMAKRVAAGRTGGVVAAGAPMGSAGGQWGPSPQASPMASRLTEPPPARPSEPGIMDRGISNLIDVMPGARTLQRTLGGAANALRAPTNLDEYSRVAQGLGRWASPQGTEQTTRAPGRPVVGG